MNVHSKATIASAISLALALACGGAIAQSSGGGGTSGSNGSAQGQAGQQPRNAQGAGQAGGANGMNGTGGMNGTSGTARGCENLATSGPQRMPEAARPVGTPARAAASNGSGDMRQPNCTNGQGSPQNGRSGTPARTPTSGGGSA